MSNLRCENCDEPIEKGVYCNNACQKERQRDTGGAMSISSLGPRKKRAEIDKLCRLAIDGDMDARRKLKRRPEIGGYGLYVIYDKEKGEEVKL